jgi:predicted  nucleic acid-binding Zn-ribbon protein
MATKTAAKATKEEKTAPAKVSLAEKHDSSVEAKLKALYELQQIDTQIDKIRIIRGELPMEVRDLEDDIAGLDTRVNNYTEELNKMEDMIVQKKQSIKDSQAAIKKYETQQMNVKNNREYDSLTKEIEYQNLEIQLSEKRIKEYTAEITAKSSIVEASATALKERKHDLELKNAELDSIISETQKEEDALSKRSDEAAQITEERLFTAYKRIRNNVRNGLAVVTVQRDACGGCFNKIPPQRQLDIRQHKKVIVCEHCGRILVDAALSGEVELIAE